VKNRSFGGVLAVAAALLLPAYAAGQEEKRWDPPRTRDGHPDIQGYWSQRSDITTYSIQAGFEDRAEHVSIGGQNPQKGRPIIDPPSATIPYQPWAAEKARMHHAVHRNPPRPDMFDPVSRCFLEGVPRIVYQGNMRILQFPTYIVLMHEFGHHYRVIYLDGRPHVPGALKLWMGDSRGRWDGNTLVVDVTNHNDRTWFDIVGSFHSDAMRITERWTFSGPDRIDYVATIDDPKVYTQPWKLQVQLGRNKPEEQYESAICEGNKAVHVAFGIPFDEKK
jgi:hypothetical protein